MSKANIKQNVRDSVCVGITNDGEYAVRFNTRKLRSHEMDPGVCCDDDITMLWKDFDTFVRTAHSDVACVLLEMKETIANCFEHDRAARAPKEE